MGEFAFYRWDHADGGMQAPPLVALPADPHNDVFAGLGPGRQAVSIEDFAMEGEDEVFLALRDGPDWGPDRIWRSLAGRL